MADGAKVRTGLAALMQDHLSDKVVDTLLNVMPLVFGFLARDGNKNGNIQSTGGSTGIYGLGRFATGVVMSGVPISKRRAEEILNSDTYMPIVKIKNPAASDGKVMGQRDTMPQRTNWDTNSPATYFKRPGFKWVERIDPIKVPKKDIRRTRSSAGNEQKASVAVGDLFRVESDSVLSTHLQWWNQHFWGTDLNATGGNDPTAHAPSNQDADVWDDIFSLSAALKTNNTYGMVDRTLTANTFWRGNLDTVHKAASLEDLVNDANYTKKLASKGNGVNLFLCGATLFPIFKAEAKAKGGIIYYDGLPNMGEFGFKKEIVRFNNTFVIFDPECPDKAHPNAYSTNHVAGLNLDTWTLAISRDANFTVDEAFDQSRLEGGDDAITSNMRTELMMACEAPSQNVYYTDVG